MLSASCHVLSFMTLREERLLAPDEYWADDGEAPAWRRRMGLGRTIEAVAHEPPAPQKK